MNRTSQIDSLWALYYEAESYNISGNTIMGRQAAGNAFLKAYALSDLDEIGVYARNPDSFKLFGQQIDSMLKPGNDKSLSYIPWGTPTNLKDFGGIFFPAPDISKLVDQRFFFGGANSYSVIGITHTTASLGVINALLECYTSQLMPWDAIICTSQSVKRSVENLYSQYYDILSERLGASRKPNFELPIIPLGVHVDDFEINDKEKKDAREKLNIMEDDIVVLFLGRLSFHAKAHHLPMYLALQKVSESLPDGVNLHFVQTGWFPNNTIESMYKNEAKKVAPSVTCHFLDGRDTKTKKISYAISDIFLSLVDNFQETFGLTPLEGMASGIPVIVSDWNGYRDTVRDGKDGFRISSTTMLPGSGYEYAIRYNLNVDTYDHYIGRASQTVSIDIKECIDKILSLALDKELRRKMGKAAKKHAQGFDWSKILHKYYELKIMLDEERIKTDTHTTKVYSPLRIQDPHTFFSDYSTIKIDLNSIVIKNLNVNNFDIADFYNFSSVSYLDNIAPDVVKIEKIYSYLIDNKQYLVSDINNDFKLEENEIYKILLWLSKFGYISIMNKSDEK